MAELKIKRGSISVRIDDKVNGKKVGVETRVVGFDYDDLTRIEIDLDVSAANAITPVPELVVKIRDKKQTLKLDKKDKKYK
ncbi:MAG: hypothetical protein M8841_07495 [marine benthic group bacterium]|jgi:hypothetical protein|nr:hypothetical protein [Gemmatimonadota bacterium]MCL7974399.1 hypothetical protein [Gemmatimonadota bacterium]MCL7977671.1 hypothetical protein [Gemmatimonadota bacterium]